MPSTLSGLFFVPTAARGWPLTGAVPRLLIVIAGTLSPTSGFGAGELLSHAFVNFLLSPVPFLCSETHEGGLLRARSRGPSVYGSPIGVGRIPVAEAGALP